MAQTAQFNLQLIVEGHPTERVPLDRSPFTLGRMPDRDCIVTDKSVSREHAELLEEPDGYYVVDRGSRFGTFVNGEKVERHKLNLADRIQLGSLTGPVLRFSSDSENTAAHPAPQQGAEFERLKWFLDAARKLNENGAIDDILLTLLEITLQLTKVERGFVFLAQEDGSLRLAVGRTADGTPQQDDSTISRSAINQAIQGTSRFVVTDNLAADPENGNDQPSASMVVNSIRSVICIPLRRRSADSAAPAMMGVLYLDSKLNVGKLSLVEHDLLETIAKEAAALVENAYLVKSEVAARKYRTELAIAAQIQTNLMKVQVPELPHIKLAAQSIPCLEIGGDFFDVIEAHDCLYVIIADISGKGISAALLASTLQGMLYALVQSGLSLPEIAAVANQFIVAKSVGKYATMVMARVTRQGLVEYMNCGHIKPLTVLGETVHKLTDSNMVVGLLANIAYESSTYQLRDGERLILVTDGVTEAENAAGDFLGDDAYEEAAKLPTAAQIMGAVQAFIGGAPSTDDCTIVEVRFTGNAA